MLRKMALPCNWERSSASARSKTAITQSPWRKTAAEVSAPRSREMALPSANNPTGVVRRGGTTTSGRAAGAGCACAGAVGGAGGGDGVTTGVGGVEAGATWGDVPAFGPDPGRETSAAEGAGADAVAAWLVRGVASRGGGAVGGGRAAGAAVPASAPSSTSITTRLPIR